MYERSHHAIVGWPHFLRRAGRHLVWALVILASAVAIGTIGYHTAGHLDWIDAFLNASMILSGMGPVDRMEGAPAKLFSALYALFSGLVFVALIGVVLAPWFHRLFHWIHLDESASGRTGGRQA